MSTRNADLRHSCFLGEDFRPDALTNDWVQLGAYGAVVSWEEDGLERIAQWSAHVGLHIYTEGMHMRCLRIVCSWAKAKAIVANIRRERMEERMKKTEEIVSRLVEAAKHGVAVTVVGVYGSGKVWLSDMAIRKMGRTANTINAAVLDEFEASRIFDRLSSDSGVVLDELHRAEPTLLPTIAQAATKYVRNDGGLLFITLPPGQENILSLFTTVTGETLGLQQTVEVPR
jgi:hypothetical protein